MEELFGYALSWLMDHIIPDLRASLGNWGCLMASILIVGVVVWFLPAYVLGWSGGDWKAWLVVGPLATIVVVIMVAGTYGLGQRSRKEVTEERASEVTAPEPAGSSALQPPSREDIEALLQELQEGNGKASLQAEQHLVKAYVLMEGDELKRALRACDAALHLDPGLAEAHNQRGIVLEKLGQTRAAAAAYRRAARLDPGFTEAEENLQEVGAKLLDSPP